MCVSALAVGPDANPGGAASRRRGPAMVWVLVGGLLVALGVVAVLSVVAGTWPYRALGNTDPGLLVRLGAPLLRGVSDLAATVCVGWLVFAVAFTAPQESGVLSAQGYGALLRAGRWATVWVVAALVMVPFDAASVAGQPLAKVLTPWGLVGLIDALEGPTAWLITAGVVLVVAIGARVTLRWQPTVVLLVLALFAVLPPLATEHSSSDAGHDLATAAIMIHVPAAVVWLGVLVALLWQTRRGGTALAQVAARYGRLALGCWLVLVGSGLVDAFVLVPLDELVSTEYGVLLVGKMMLVAAVGMAGVTLRRRALHRAVAGQRTGMVGLATGELFVLAVTFAVSVGLTHLPPPAFVGHPVTADQTLLGYSLTGAPTLVRLVANWRVEVLFASLAALLAVGYLIGVWRLRRHGQRWPAGRTATWLAGCAVILIATSSGIGRYAAAMFSLHIASHMLVAMLAPMLLALGGPLTLLRAILPPASPGELPGPREWVNTLTQSPLSQLLTHPLVALSLYAVAPFVLYFTGLFDAAVRFHWGHMAINVVFLVIGYLFAWPTIGVDPAPRPMPTLARLGMLLAAMPADIIFGAVLMTTRHVIGNGPAGANMYSALALPWVHSLLADQRLAGGIALAVGEASLLVALVALLLRWQQLDTAPDSVGLAGYDSMLAELARRGREAP